MERCTLREREKERTNKTQEDRREKRAEMEVSSHTNDLSLVLPRVLIVSRRTVRKNKFVDFVGEF